MTINLYSLLNPVIEERIEALNKNFKDNSRGLQEPLHHSDRRQAIGDQLISEQNCLEDLLRGWDSDKTLLLKCSQTPAFLACYRGKQTLYLQINLFGCYPSSLEHEGKPVRLCSCSAPIIIAMKKALANGETDCSEWGLTGIEQIVCNLQR